MMGLGWGTLGLMVAGVTLTAAGQSRSVSLEAADCSRINMMFDNRPVGRAVQHVLIPVSAGTLDLQPSQNGGVQIEKGTGSQYSITACVAAGGDSLAEAQRAAEKVRLVVTGNRVRVDEGGNRANWGVHLIVETPDGARINAETTNGPLSVTGASGTFSLRASNGPIDLENVGGRATAQAVNGPISVQGDRGELDVETSNGPITVHLTGARWDGRLDARAHSGPLHVNVPKGYRSGVEISSSGHSPWDCRLDACKTGASAAEWRSSRTMRVGTDAVVVKVSTVNGPVTVEEARRR